MPRYELSLIYRIMERPELKAAIKRASEIIIKKGGIIRSMEYLGSKKLPYNMFRHGNKFENGNYFLMQFESSPSNINELRETLTLDLDVVKPKVLAVEEEISRPCKERRCDFGELTIESRKQLKKDIVTYIKKL